MRLPDFISANIEPIMAEWENFAKTLPSGSGMDRSEIRDHAAQLLRAAAEDMNSHQTTTQQKDKSKGTEDTNEKSEEIADASKLHAAERATAGFRLSELVAEYRNLRASVLSLWDINTHSYDSTDVTDISRFNECIDQSLTLTLKIYTDRVERGQQTFLAILGHDLRSPLNVIKLATVVLSEDQAAGKKSEEVIALMASSTATMEKLISDLIEFAGSALASRPALVKTKMSLRSLCQEVIAEVKVAHPNIKIIFDAGAEYIGDWDHARIRQVISNLLNNAIQFGNMQCPVEIKLSEEGSQTLLQVTNQGLPIPAAEIKTIFEPLVQGRNENTRIKRSGSLGLGLYIVKEVVSSHGGNVEVESSAQGITTFSVHLPTGLEHITQKAA